MGPTPKHAEISQKLLQEIISGAFGATGRLPSEAQLVKRFKVSRPTIARAFRDLQEQGLIQRRAGSGTYLRPASSVPTAVSNRQFGLLIPGLGTTEIFDVICGELASLARHHEYGLLWGSTTKPTGSLETVLAEIEQSCDQFIRQKVSGVFFAPFDAAPRDLASKRLAERLRQAGIAVILLDRDIVPFPQRSEFDLVGIDNFAAGYMVAEHLLKLGCKRPAFIMRPHSAPTTAARLAGARTAMIDRDLPVPKNFVHVGKAEDPVFIESLASSESDGAIRANDQTAAALILALQKKGIRVPTDVRIVGFDDVRFATLVSVPLTTVHQPCREIAVTAFSAMLERIANPMLPPRAFALTPRLVIRESCGAILRSVRPA